MGGWAARRFWKQAQVTPSGSGFAVLLDDRSLRTPGKVPLVVPTLAMAEAVAAEWDAQDGEIRPATMPVTRSANSAIDKVTPQFGEVCRLLSAYGETDLLCHRAGSPEALDARQSAGWDPLLDWSASDLGAPLIPVCGVMPAVQPAESLAALAQRVAALDPFRLTALHDLVAISGSLVIGLAVLRGRIDAETGWQLSRIDETWQAEQWGVDDEAAAAEAAKRTDFLHAGRFVGLCG
ncbi:MAG: ATP12 family chaperone protein [Gemmobacter sp.]